MRDGLPREWTLLAACRDGEPDALFVRGSAQHIAKRVCLVCPVRLDCLVDALDNDINHGVWGGMTERERRALRRRFPQVRDWRPLLTRGARPAPAGAAVSVAGAAAGRAGTGAHPVRVVPAGEPANHHVVAVAAQR